MTLSDPWHVEFIEGGSAFPKPFATKELKSWTDLGDPAAEAFSGTAVYRTSFDFTGSVGEPVVLDLGEVRNVVRVKINNRPLGSLIMHPYRIDIPPNILKPCDNQLELEVTNLGANRLRDLDRRGILWRKFHDANVVSITYKPFDASGWPAAPSGLLGRVRLTH